MAQSLIWLFIFNDILCLSGHIRSLYKMSGKQHVSGRLSERVFWIQLACVFTVVWFCFTLKKDSLNTLMTCIYVHIYIMCVNIFNFTVSHAHSNERFSSGHCAECDSRHHMLSFKFLPFSLQSMCLLRVGFSNTFSFHLFIILWASHYFSSYRYTLRLTKGKEKESHKKKNSFL